MFPSLRPDLASALAELALRELAQAGFGRSDATGRSEVAVLADALDAPAAVLALEDCGADGGGPGLRVAAAARWDGLPDALPAGGAFAVALSRGAPVALRPVPEALATAGVASGLAVCIGPRHRPFALVAVVDSAARTFDDDERAFLRAAASALHARFALDATRQARRRAEGALREREAELQTFVEHAPAALALFDRDMRYLAASRRWRRDYGLADDVEGRSHYDVFPELPERWREIYPRALAGEVLRGEDDPFDRADGHVEWLRWEARPWHDRAGHVAGVVLFTEDVSARVEAEHALRESEARARAVLETMVDGVVTIDERGVIEGFNAAAERIFGYAAHDVVGRNLSVLMPEPYHSEHDGYLEAYRASGVPQIIGVGREVVGRREDGSTFPMDLAVSEVWLPDGRRVFTGFVRDITARRELEHEVLRATEDERRRIGQDLHDGLGQELSTLGLFLTGLARTLDAEGSAGAPLAHRLTGLAEGADGRARSLARSLVPVELSENGLAVAIRRLAERTEALHGVEVGVDVVGDGPARAKALTPEAATNLYWIAQEALSNALRHGRARHVRIVLAQGPVHFRLRVENDGAPFAPPPPHARRRTVRGMGLRIMDHRAHLAGGRLDARPGPEGGAVVTCTVPFHGPGFHSPPSTPAA